MVNNDLSVGHTKPHDTTWLHAREVHILCTQTISMNVVHLLSEAVAVSQRNLPWSRTAWRDITAIWSGILHQSYRWSHKVLYVTHMAKDTEVKTWGQTSIGTMCRSRMWWGVWAKTVNPSSQVILLPFLFKLHVQQFHLPPIVAPKVLHPWVMHLLSVNKESCHKHCIGIP